MMETNAMKQGTPPLQQDAVEFDPTSLSEDRSSRIASLLGLVLTLATIAMIIVAARELSLQAIMAMLPTRPLFWIASVAGAALVITFALRQGGGALADLLQEGGVGVAAQAVGLPAGGIEAVDDEVRQSPQLVMLPGGREVFEMTKADEAGRNARHNGRCFKFFPKYGQ